MTGRELEGSKKGRERERERERESESMKREEDCTRGEQDGCDKGEWVRGG
jgi:hypothetical protein